MRSFVARRSSLVLLAVLSAALLPTCGRKTPVRPPEAVAPETIENLNGFNVLEGIRLGWARPRESVDGTKLYDLGGFRIERAEGSGPFGVIGRVQVMDRTRIRQRRRFIYTDMMVNPGASYRYRVVSYTVDGDTSDPSNVVAVTREVPPTPVMTPQAPPPTR
jgi:hypothetical protein